MKGGVRAAVDVLQTTADGKLDAATIKSNRPAFAEAVAHAANGTAEIDWAELIPELDLVDNYAKTTNTSTAYIEKLHKSNKDFATARGNGKVKFETSTWCKDRMW